MRVLVLFFIFSFSLTSSFANRNESTIKGKVTSQNGEIVEFASVYLKKTSYGCITNTNGRYKLLAPSGNYTLVVSLMGYKTVEKQISIKTGEEKTLNIVLEENALELDEIVITEKSVVQQVKESAYNAVAIDVKASHNTTNQLTDVLTKAPGIKIRESGGIGSDTRLMMDGFSGRHIKIFIDGVPQEGVGGAFDLNNIPVNFAERIEVYKGVVPVGFGSDALGGIVNIVTNKNRENWFVDASYSFGSFNTHKSNINAGQTFKNGLIYEINAFQNYSDNNYYIDVAVEEFQGPNANDGSQINSKNIQHVRRFHDTYHNEAIVGKVGIVGKKWADRLMVGFTYSQYYKEIQNGVIQKLVFGEKFREGNSIMPSLEYRKRDLFLKGLDVTLTANYNKNEVRNVDTSSYKFNWRGEKQKLSSPGESSYQDTRSDNNNWNGTFTANYRLKEIHTFSFNHVLNTFYRKNTSASGSSNTNLANAIPKETQKNISGLSYRLTPSEKWNFSAFGKYYHQSNSGPLATSTAGDEYVRSTRTVSAMGYGAAGTYFFLKDFQAKLSYEKAYRLPTDEEMFGDEDLEQGDFNLKAENSDNFNVNIGYNRRFGMHSLFFEGGLVYRNAKDYIKRVVNGDTSIKGKSYGSYENHGKVETKGYSISMQYSYSDWISIGGNFTQMDVRDNVKTVESASNQVNITYGMRLPNTPYLFANSDVTLYWHNFLKKGTTLSFTYDNYYQHSFPRYWEGLGSDSEYLIPSQFSHNLGITYSIKNGRYNFSFECRNFTNKKLYDNFSLQKAGRAFYGKLRVYLGSR